MESFKNKLIKALTLQVPYSASSPSQPRKKDQSQSAVALLIGFHKNTPHLLFTKRSEHVEHHKSEISFPGGMQARNETLIETVRRETLEEIYLPPHQWNVLGNLDPFFTLSSAIDIHPFVGIVEQEIEHLTLKAHTHEVESFFWIPFKSLLEQEKIEEFKWKGKTIKTPVYYHEDHKIWGATALMTLNLCLKLKKAQG